MNTNCMAYSPLDPLILGILQYNQTTSAGGLPNTTAWDDQQEPVCRDLNVTELSPLNNDIPMPPTSDLFVRIDASFQTGPGELNLAYMNTSSWVPLNNTSVLLKSASEPNTSVLGVDPAFNVKSQFVYSIPTIQTVEYTLLYHPMLT
jgi:hypothetical protein